MYLQSMKRNKDDVFKLFASFLMVIISYQAVLSQQTTLENFCLSTNELQLFERINELRTDYDKSMLQLSASLCYVAKTHVKDLLENQPDTSICGLSSWSDQGQWKACCYNKYVLDEDCMWDKPKELTSYPYRGYELVTYFEDDFTSDSVINIWSGSREVLDMILTQGKYASKKWACVGVGMNNDYVSLWFGQRNDPASKPVICDTLSPQSDNQTAMKPAEDSFYLIFGSFEDISDAKEALRRLKKNNFPDADILIKDGLNRIYLGKYDNLKAAMYAKQNLPFSYREAWIFKN